MGEQSGKKRQLGELSFDALYRRGAKNYRKRVGPTRLSKPGSLQAKWDRLHFERLRKGQDEVDTIATHLWKAASPRDVCDSFAHYLLSIFDAHEGLFLEHALRSSIGLKEEDLINLAMESPDAASLNPEMQVPEGFRRAVQNWCSRMEGPSMLLECCAKTGLPGLVVRIAKFAVPGGTVDVGAVERLRKTLDVAGFIEEIDVLPELPVERQKWNTEILKRIGAHRKARKGAGEDDAYFLAAQLRIRLETTPESVQRILSECEDARAMLGEYHRRLGAEHPDDLVEQAVLPRDLHTRTRLSLMVLQHELGQSSPIQTGSARYHALLRVCRSLMGMIVPYLERVSAEHRARLSANRERRDQDQD